jgi:hypothetical protein
LEVLWMIFSLGFVSSGNIIAPGTQHYWIVAWLHMHFDYTCPEWRDKDFSFFKWKSTKKNCQCLIAKDAKTNNENVTMTPNRGNYCIKWKYKKSVWKYILITVTADVDVCTNGGRIMLTRIVGGSSKSQIFDTIMF